jgi:ABC-type amino acid transport substrate-binding protein
MGVITVPVRATLVHDLPYVYNDTNLGRTTGLAIDIFEAALAYINAAARPDGNNNSLLYRAVYRDTADGQYGGSKPGGGWTGAIGEILSGVADVGIGQITLTAARQAVVDFTGQFPGAILQFGAILAA